MFTLVIVLAIIAAILLILIVLIQNPKGGGIAANFSAANQIAGVKRTNDFIEKATWTLAIALLVFSLSSGYLYRTGGTQESIMQEQLENAPTGLPDAGGASDFAPEGGQNPATPQEGETAPLTPAE
ncbi:MAG: preprotein translocase subunit SecG [Bacteroidia bacterium]